MKRVTKSDYNAVISVLFQQLLQLQLRTNELLYDVRLDTESTVSCRKLLGGINTTIASSLALIDLHSSIKNNFKVCLTMVCNNLAVYMETLMAYLEQYQDVLVACTLDETFGDAIDKYVNYVNTLKYNFDVIFEEFLTFETKELLAAVRNSRNMTPSNSDEFGDTDIDNINDEDDDDDDNDNKILQ